MPSLKEMQDDEKELTLKLDPIEIKETVIKEESDECSKLSCISRSDSESKSLNFSEKLNQ